MPMSEETAKKIVGRPLTPEILEEIEALNPFPEPDPQFSPDGNRTMLYRIWLNHGYYGLLNLNAGFLRIERKTGSALDRFTLIIERQSVNWEGIVNSIQAEIQCNNDAISTPVSWTYTSRFTDTGGTVVPELSVNHNAHFENMTLIQEINGSEFTRYTGTAMTCDWCLFDAVQRLPFDSSVYSEFDVLEGLTVLKKNNSLSYRSKHTDSFKRLNIPLFSFVRMGDGVLPYEYWLDRYHRLLMAISGDRVYILDDKAGETFAGEVAQHRGGKYSWQNKL